MRRPKPHPIRNKLDLSDRTQVRLVRKRLGLSDAELTEIIARVGNSLSAVSKEVALQRAAGLPQQPADVSAAAAIASVPDRATTELTSNDPAP